jgi:hypothetical protein
VNFYAGSKNYPFGNFLALSIQMDMINLNTKVDMTQLCERILRPPYGRLICADVRQMGGFLMAKHGGSSIRSGEQK